MPLRFEAWTLPSTGTFEKRFDVDKALPGSSGVRELSSYADGTLMVPASWSRLDELVSTTTGSLIRVYKGTTLIDEFEAERVSFTAGRPNVRSVTGKQRNGLLEGIGLAPKNYPNHKAGSLHWKYGVESAFPPLDLADLGNVREQWVVATDATGGTWNVAVDGDNTDLDFDASANQVEGSATNGSGMQGDLTTVNDVTVSGTGAKEVWELYVSGASSGDIVVDFGGGDEATFAYNANAATVEAALEGTTAIIACSVSGAGTMGDPWVITFHNPAIMPDYEIDDSDLDAGSATRDITTDGDPWIITFYDPPDPSSVSFDSTNLTGGSGPNNGMLAYQSIAGNLDPSPITKSKPVDAGAGPEEDHGNYGEPPIEVDTDPANQDTTSDWVLRVNALDDTIPYPGSQIVIDVTPGETYSDLSVRVDPDATSQYTIVVRTVAGDLIAEDRDNLLTTGSYTALEIPSFVVPAGVNQILIRVANTQASPVNRRHRVNWQEATLSTGAPAQPYTDILTEILAAAQARGVGDWLEIDANTGEDTLGTSLDDISFTAFVGDNANFVNAVLDEGRKRGYQWDVVPEGDADVITPDSSTTHVLQIFKVDADEIEDLTSSTGGPSVLVGAHVSDAEMVARRYPFTTLIGLGAESVYAEVSDATAESNIGRVERIIDLDGIGNAVDVDAALDARFAEEAVNQTAASATILEGASQLPLVDYRPGSKIWWQFPGILDKEARPVKRVGWVHGSTAQFQIQGSKVLSGEAAMAAAVDMFLRKPGRRRDDKPTVSPTSLGGGNVALGAYVHVLRSATQSIANGGEDISWDQPNIFSRFNFAAPMYPTTDITIQEPGYYNVAVTAAWDSWEGGGTLQVVHTRAGSVTELAPLVASDGQSVSGIAHAVPCMAGDVVSVFIDHGDSSSQDLASASLDVYLVDEEGVTTSAVGIESVGYFNETNADTYQLPLPQSELGDLLIVAAATEDEPETVAMSGWTSFASFEHTVIRASWWYRVADGSEGSTAELTASADLDSIGAVIWRVRSDVDYSTFPPDFARNSATTVAPSVSPSHGNSRYAVFVAACTHNYFGPSGPPNYSQLERSEDFDDLSHPHVYVSEAEVVTAASISPGEVSFVSDSGSSRNLDFATIVVKVV